MDDVSAQQSPGSQIPPKNSNTLFAVFKYVTIGTGILGIGFLIALGGYLFAANNRKEIIQAPTPVAVETPAPVATQTPVASPSVEDTNVPNQKRYINPGLGISFIFPSKAGQDTIDVKEAGNKIYVYNTKYPYTRGQYVEVFQKSTQDSLTKALQKQFLANISPNDCFVKDSKAANYSSSYEVKILGYPVDQNSDIPSFAQPNKCPSPYAEANGIAYFLGNTNHPKIFLFLSIGQYIFPLDAQGTKSWQDTIEFTD